MSSKYNFDYIKINLASPQRIRSWAQRTLPNGQVIGEVLKPETINYRTFKPEIEFKLQIGVQILILQDY